MPTKGFSPDFFDALEAYDWPGNIRELINTLDGTLAIAGQEATLFAKHLPVHIRIRKARSSLKQGVPERNAASALIREDQELPKLREFRKTLEKQYLQDLILRSKGDMRNACRISGLSRSRLYDLLSKNGLSFS
jgi:two-component system NtrC family response regulator